MGSILYALLGLTGLVCSAVLAIGLGGGDRQPPADAPLKYRVSSAKWSISPMSDQAYPNMQVGADEECSIPSSSEQAGTPDAGRIRLHRICRVTAYCDRRIAASGVQSGLGQCAAPADVPFGAVVYIPALDRAFVVTDRTHRRFRRSTVDIFLPTSRQCREFGCQYLECVITLPDKNTRRLTRR